MSFAKTGLSKVKEHASAVTRAGDMFPKLVPSSAMPFITIELKYAATLLPGPVNDVSKHIQDTIRVNGVSLYSKQARDWGLSEEDRLKNLAPLMDRAFAINTQIGTIAAQATQKVIDNLNVLIEKFESDQLGPAIREKALAGIKQIEVGQKGII